MKRHRDWAIALLALTTKPITATNCTRETMSYPVNYYVWSQTQGQIGTLPVVDSVPYTENFKPLWFISGMVGQPLILDWNATFYDTSTCTAFAELVATRTEQEKSYVMGTRIEMKEWHEVGEPAPDGVGPLVVTKMDAIVTTTGDWLYNASASLQHYRNERAWAGIPASARDTRATLKAAADAYADKFSNSSVEVPFGTPCCRIEGGASTCAGEGELALNTCHKGFPRNPQYLTNRTYVIDKEMGVVQVNMILNGMPDSHVFRIEEGRIRSVHTMSDCGDKGCSYGNATVPTI
jgi:hypothetical protein